MFARILTGALLTAAATFALAPTASAQPTPDWNTFYDKTANFVAPFDPAPSATRATGHSC